MTLSGLIREPIFSMGVSVGIRAKLRSVLADISF